MNVVLSDSAGTQVDSAAVNVLGTTGPVQVQNPDEEELGEKRLYKLIARNAADEPADMLDGIHTAVEAFADGEPLPADLTLVILARD